MENLYADPIINGFLKAYQVEHWEYAIRTLVVYSIRTVGNVFTPKAPVSVYELEAFCNNHSASVCSFNQDFRDLCGQLHHIDKKMIGLLNKADAFGCVKTCQNSLSKSTGCKRNKLKPSCKTSLVISEDFSDPVIMQLKENNEVANTKKDKKRQASFDSSCTQRSHTELSAYHSCQKITQNNGAPHNISTKGTLNKGNPPPKISHIKCQGIKENVREKEICIDSSRANPGCLRINKPKDCIQLLKDSKKIPQNKGVVDIATEFLNNSIINKFSNDSGKKTDRVQRKEDSNINSVVNYGNKKLLKNNLKVGKTKEIPEEAGETYGGVDCEFGRQNTKASKQFNNNIILMGN